MTEPRDPARAYVDYDIRSPFRSYLRVGRDLIVEPEAFFRAVRGGGLWGPTFFVFITYLALTPLSALIVLAPVMVYLGPTAAQNVASVSGQVLMLSLVVVVAVLILAAFSGVFGTFVGALLWHPFVAVSVGVGRGAGFRETYRIGAYQSLPYVLGASIPFFGILLAVAAMSYVGVFGVRGAHGTTTTRAIVSVAVPLALTFLLVVAALVAAFAVADRKGF